MYVHSNKPKTKIDILLQPKPSIHSDNVPFHLFSFLLTFRHDPANLCSTIACESNHQFLISTLLPIHSNKEEHDVKTYEKELLRRNYLLQARNPLLPISPRTNRSRRDDVDRMAYQVRSLRRLLLMGPGYL
jgi:hypothetical protein